jgi:hypothetical protein
MLRGFARSLARQRRERAPTLRRRPSRPVTDKETLPMSQNLIDLDLSAESLQAIDDALGVLETRLAGLIALDPDARRQLTKMGDRSEAFCRQAVQAFAQNAELLPRNFDVEGYQRDLLALDQLRARLHRVDRLQEKLADTATALGSDLMTNSLEGYAVLKRSGRGTGLEGLRQMLSVRFTRGKRSAAPEAPEPA